MIELYDYQNDAISEIKLSYKLGNRAPLLVLPTGGGKTTIFSDIASKAVQKNRCVYVIAHRANLIKQAAMRLAEFGVESCIIANADVVRQAQIAQFKKLGKSFVKQDSKVIVASVQTLVKRLDSVPKPDLIIGDEGHHFTQDSNWGVVVNAFPDARLLLVTATPCRLDGKGLGISSGGFADDLIIGPSMRDLINEKKLSDYRIVAPPNLLDLSSIKTRAGDYAKDQLVKAMDKPTITGDAVSQYKKISQGKRAVAFCVSVEHANHVASEFNDAGIKAESISGKMDASMQDDILRRFELGEFLVLTSCDIISEGFDVPAIETVILLRPTQSLSLFLQQVGRGLRTFPGKDLAIIIDHVGAIRSHGFPDDDREWTLDGLKSKPKQDKEDASIDAVESIMSCPKCFAIHRPAKVCPSCSYEYPIRERKVEIDDSELIEISKEQVDLLRKQKRIMQGSAKTVEQLVAQGMNRFRAIKIVEARKEKIRLIGSIMDALNEYRQNTGLSIFAGLGTTLQAIQRMKPKELKALKADVDSKNLLTKSIKDDLQVKIA